MELPVFLVINISLLSLSNAYNILCIFPLPSRSHNALGKAFVDALLNRGHQVTWLTPFPELLGENPQKSLKVIDVSAAKQYVTAADLMYRSNNTNGPTVLKMYSTNVTKIIFANQEFREIFTKVQFDAVVTDTFFSDVHAGFAAVQQAPWILLSTTSLTPELQAQVDEVRSVTVPIMNETNIPMTFWERLLNTFRYTAIALNGWLDRTPRKHLYKALFSPLAKARGVELPPLEDSFYNVSILFINSHESLGPAFSVPPNVINIAGFHIPEDILTLPEDVQVLLDSSPQGVIYFSIGPVLNSTVVSEATKLDLLKGFSALNQTILWEFDDKIQALPKNVFVRGSLQQSGILAHPNVRVFVSHGGLLSTLEAVNAGVPLLAVSTAGDNSANIEQAVRTGFARKVSFSSSEIAKNIAEELKEMISNDSYSKTAKHLSKLFHARPVSPKKLIPHYVELAIETKGAYHIRSPSHHYPWYQRWMLDQVIFLIVTLVILTELVRIAVGTCLRVFTPKIQSSVLKEKTS